jgi:hypothetical protein
MSCYVCLEECNEKSPCECEHIVHDKCLHQTCKTQSIIHCTICKSHLGGYSFKNSSSKNSDYNIIESNDSDSDSDSNDSVDLNNSYYIEISKWKYYIFYFIWWIFLSTILSGIWAPMICISFICNVNGYSAILCVAFLLEFIIISFSINCIRIL